MMRISLVSFALWCAGQSILMAQSVADWLPMINFRPALPHQTALMTRPAAAPAGLWHFQKLEAGNGPLGLDAYGLTVIKPPKAAGRELKPDEVLHWIRTQFTDFLDPALASSRVEGFEDQWKWQSSSAGAGAVIHVTLAKATPPGTACLALTEQTPASWVLSTVHAADTARRNWPVSGNRWFGWTALGSPADPDPETSLTGRKGKPAPRAAARPAGHQPYQIITRGAWRLPAGTPPDQWDTIAAHEEAFWKGFVQRVQTFIIDQGGECGPALPPDGTMRQDWEPIRQANFVPAVHWVDPEGTWTSTDAKNRFRLVIHPGFQQCEFIERSASGLELRRTVPIQSAGDGEGWKVERSSVDPETLGFLGFDAKTTAQIIAAAPPPSYLIFSRKGPLLKAKWCGFILERDGKGGVAAIKAPGATRHKEYDFTLTPAPQ